MPNSPRVQVNPWEERLAASRSRDLPEEIWGTDVFVHVGKTVYGPFPRIHVKVVRQTECYYFGVAPRVPRYMDGEVIIVWEIQTADLSKGSMAKIFKRLPEDQTVNYRLRGQRQRFSITFLQANGPYDTQEFEFNPNDQVRPRVREWLRMLDSKTDNLTVKPLDNPSRFRVTKWQGIASGIGSMPAEPLRRR